MAATVFVSGASGFIAQHVIKQLLEKGYSVVGSVRSESKGENLKKNFDTDELSYEVVEDLETVGAFDSALKKHPDVTIFIHTASPVAFQVNDNEKDIIIPAINGTVNVLQAIKTSAPKVKKVIITSSIVTQLQIDDLSQTATEDTWSNISYDRAKEDGYAAYFGSKAFAEKAGIEFVKSEKPNFTLSTIHPVYVFGPQVFDSEAKGSLNLSNTFVSRLLELKSESDSQVPNTSGSFVDVRDVAAAHIIEIEKPSNGLRVITSNDVFTSQKLLNIINKNFPDLNLIKGDTSPSAEDTKSNVDDTKSREYLGLDYIGLEESVVQTVKQYLVANK
ncbi:putative NADPH-dependent methylglyoxal reductase Grp2p [[Candida] railenensis]|uniref:NADPH-dependent methylglyoxal reductase Grp2p n=1 Tax=[Candida] railenensis TaxID=45579 RepID=A0A9P0QTB0_9ASCO|nr:putative NADPH-dependent methylglyoxal reductase Grp2p [[Candida] railenensis]